MPLSAQSKHASGAWAHGYQAVQAHEQSKEDL